MGCSKSKKTRQETGLRVPKPGEKNTDAVLKPKIILLGDSEVGKTALICCYHDGVYTEINERTLVGQDYEHKTKLPNGVEINMQIWDTSGTTKSSPTVTPMQRIYYRDVKAAIFIYDVSNSKTLDGMNYWVNQLSEHVDMKQTVLVLAANKIDLATGLKITANTGKKFADTNFMAYKEVSAKDPKSVKKLFEEVANEVYERNQDAIPPAKN